MDATEEFMKKYYQCWRCGMYLPREEMQQWKGMWYCPYCLAEIIEEEERLQKMVDKKQTEKKTPKPPHIDEEKAPDIRGPDNAPASTPLIVKKRREDDQFTCDKCGHVMDKIFILSDHKFCERCFNGYIKELKENNLTLPPYVVLRRKKSDFFLLGFLKELKRRITNAWKRREMARRAKQKKKKD